SGTLDARTLPTRCQVCGKSVFFYQNEFGSRVFFDELGPPWTKHDCTDTSIHNANHARRKVETASINDDAAKGIIDQNPARSTSSLLMRDNAPGWRLMLIVQRQLRDGRIHVVAQEDQGPPLLAKFSVPADVNFPSE